MYTAMTDLKGHEGLLERPLGHYDGHTRSWDDFHAEEVAAAESDPTVLISELHSARVQQVSDCL